MPLKFIIIINKTKKKSEMYFTVLYNLSVYTYNFQPIVLSVWVLILHHPRRPLFKDVKPLHIYLKSK